MRTGESVTQSVRRRTRARQGRPCAVSGCQNGLGNSLARHCHRHRHAASRNGSPTAPFIRKATLLPSLKDSRRVIKANASHPALTQLAFDLDILLRDASDRAIAYTGRPAPEDFKRKADRECLRLRDAGVTGLDILATITAVYAFSYRHPNQLQRYSRPFYFASANHVLALTTREQTRANGKGRRETIAISPRVRDFIGHELVTACDLVSVALVASIDGESEATRDRNLRIAKMLTASPFVTR